MATLLTITNAGNNGNKVAVVRCYIGASAEMMHIEMMQREAEIDVADRLLEDFLAWVASLSLKRRAMWLVHAVQALGSKTARRYYFREGETSSCSAWSTEKERERSHLLRMDDMFTISEEEEE
jgi:hypothetical protein